MREISAAILAGGLGTRLRSVVADVPKVIAPVGGRPFIYFLLDHLHRADIRDVVLLTGHGASQITGLLGERYLEMTLTYSREQAPLGTGGAVRNGLACIKSETFLLLNGDSFCDVDLQGLHEHHRRNSADLTLALARVAGTGRYGRVCMDDAGKVTGFAEKQSNVGSGLINAGVYVMSKALAMEIPLERFSSLEHEMLPRWVERRRVLGFTASERFVDIGTPESYAMAETLFNSEPTATANWSCPPSPLAPG